MFKFFKKSFIVFIFALLTLILSSFTVCASGITANAVVNGNIITISGAVSNPEGSCEVSLLVGGPGNILYIDQVTSATDGSFEFVFSLAESLPKGQYTYSIGSNAGVGKYSGVINYGKQVVNAENNFLNADLTISVKTYVPSITGTIRCSEGKSVNVIVTNITNNEIIANESITSENGAHNVSYILPSLISAKEYSLVIKALDGINEQVVLNMVVDSSVILVEATGSISVSDDTSLDVRVKSVGTDLIDKSATVTASRSVSVTIPNLLANATVEVLADGYEELEFYDDETELAITANAQITDSAVKVSGNANPAYKLDLSAELVNSDSEVVGQGNFQSNYDGSYSYTFTDIDLESGLYRVNVYVTDEIFASDDVFISIPIEKIDITKSENERLYLALKKARPTLDADNNRTITVSELESITGTLDLSNSSIESIDGLQGCTSITELYINDNKILSLDSLSMLNKITVLIADNNNISNVDLLPSTLTYLNVSKNNLTDMECVQYINNLEYLFADENDISDIDCLENKSKLKSLSLSDNSISDISVLSGCTGLTYLNLSHNEIKDVSSLNLLTNLRDLRLSSNLISNITLVPNVKYRNLYLDNNSISLSSISVFNAVNKVYLPQRSN